MRPRFSLFVKIILWFLLSFSLISGAAVLVFFVQARNDPESAFRGKSVERLRAAVHLIAGELEKSPRDQWNSVLERWTEAYNSTFMIYHKNGERIAGPEKPRLPKDVSHLLSERGKFLVKTTMPRRFWLGLPIPGFVDDIGKFHKQPRLRSRLRMGLGRGMAGKRGALVLVIMSDPKRGDGLFSDATPWLIVGLIIVALSVLLWLPLVRNLTRPIGRMTHAAEMIALGKFDTRVGEGRSDEIGRLGKAINNMAGKLSHLVYGQKRFLGDVSHELRSPLARIQVAMELLEQTADDKQREYIKDGLEEVDEMSRLVGELLSVARAEVNPDKVTLEPVELAPIVTRVLEREGKGEERIQVDLEQNLVVMADSALLTRALSNLARNAIRYAGDFGPVSIIGKGYKERVRIEVIDSGPGVPDNAIDHLFDPFFRPETDRDRNSGGTGLGLAIVKTCVDGCEGSVSAKNLSGQGFAVTIVLKKG